MLLEHSQTGVVCELGGFAIDPTSGVETAIITHAHSDHARPGSKTYICSEQCAPLLRARLPEGARIEPLAWAESRDFGSVRVSLHPAGHIRGSAQVRVEAKSHVVVVSGDYKTTLDPTCDPIEPLRCDMFFSESTFALPIYRWPAPKDVFEDIHRWWRENQQHGRTSLLLAYALGKAQRLLAGLDARVGPILLHGAVERFADLYRAAGVTLPETLPCDVEHAKTYRGQALVIAPPSAAGTPWQRKLGRTSVASASGWMTLRGRRKQGNLDRGFVISDHADWNGLIDTIRGTSARNVVLQHGFAEPLARWLQEQDINATVAPDRRAK